MALAQAFDAVDRLGADRLRHAVEERVVMRDEGDVVGRIAGRDGEVRHPLHERVADMRADAAVADRPRDRGIRHPGIEHHAEVDRVHGHVGEVAGARHGDAATSGCVKNANCRFTLVGAACSSYS